jgi:5-methylcytosine-specific restriction endonuclease McrA
MEEVLQIIANYYKVPVDSLGCRSRKPELIRRKFMCYKLLSEEYNIDLTKIGEIIGKKTEYNSKGTYDHSSVSHGIAKIQDFIETEKKVRDDYLILIDLILNKNGQSQLMSESVEPKNKRWSLRQTVYDKCNGHCAYCGKEIKIEDMSIDHIIPSNPKEKELRELNYSPRDVNEINNLLPSCFECNCQKANLSLETFRNLIIDQIRQIKKNFAFRLLLNTLNFQYDKEFKLFYFEKISKK